VRAAVAVAPRPRHAVTAVPRPAVAAPGPEGERRQRPCAVAAVPRPVAATPLHRRAVAEVPRSAAGPLCGQAVTSPKLRGGGTSKAGEQATPVDVRVATATHEARCSSERRHGRREMRAAMITRDILRSGAVFFFDYCVLCLPHVLFTLKLYDFMLEHGVRISVYCMHIRKAIL
jgi:hypothetical protein